MVKTTTILTVMGVMVMGDMVTVMAIMVMAVITTMNWHTTRINRL